MGEIVIVILILLLLSLCQSSSFEFFMESLRGKIPTKSTLDGRSYDVVDRKGIGHAVSANLLAYMNKIMAGTVRHLRNKYIWEKNRPSYNPYDTADYEFPDMEFKKAIRRLLFRYNPSVVIENSPPTTKNTSYVKNKGSEIAFCLRKNLEFRIEGGRRVMRMSPLLEREDIFAFVALHELSHICTVKIGHGNSYWRVFKFLLIEATEAGLIKPVDYSKQPVVYCGLKINYNPYFDVAL